MTEAQLRDILEQLPERAAPLADLPAVRRKNELRDMIRAHLDGGTVQIVRIEGRIPYDVTAYDVVLRTPYLLCKSLPRFANGPEALLPVLAEPGICETLSVAHGLPVRVLLHPAHPDRSCPPGIYLLEHRVWSPCVLGPVLCWAERYKPFMFLPDILSQVAGLLSYDLESDLDSPLNRSAAEWVAAGHPGVELPLRAEGKEQ